MLGAALALASVAGPAGAQFVSIPGLFNTGVDALGNPINVGGTADPHYLIVETGNAAELFHPPHPAYVTSASSRWIWQTNGGSPGNVTRTFRTTFDLTGLDPTTASIGGSWAVDNIGVNVFLNGVGTGITAPLAFGAFNPFTISSGFVAGVNTLDFQVTDQGAPGGLNVTGLAGRAAIAPTATIPEPATVALLGSGLLGLGAVARRRRAG